MTRWGGIIVLLLTASMAPGCNLLPTTPTSGKTNVTASGVVRQFVLPQGEATRLDLGSAKRLLLAVSASDSTAPSFQFRIQSVAPDESRFHQGDAELLKEPGALSERAGRTTQAGGLASDTFWINIGDSTLQGDRQRTATLRLTTAHAYFYLDTEALADVSADQLQQLAGTFETRIYPTVTNVFGADPRTDLNGDSHVYIVLSPAVDNFGQDKGLMGYFWSRDMLSMSSSPLSPRNHSNQKKAIFLTSRLFNQQPYTTFGTLAHEFTHLCIFNQKVLLPSRTVPEDTWLDEGWAMLAMDLCGYGLRAGNDEIAKDIKGFQDQPIAYSLTDWTRNPHGFSYGLSYLFTRYLYDRYGIDAVHDALSQAAVGVDSLQGALSSRGSNFRDFFADWTIANAISGMGYSNDKRFLYASDINLRGTYGTTVLSGIHPKAIASFPQELPETLRPWGTAYYDLNSNVTRAWSFDFRNPMGLFGGAVLLN